MSTYIIPGKPLEFDNAPDWLVGYMRYRRTMFNSSDQTLMTYFIDLRGFFQWASFYQKTGRNPKDEKSLRQIQIYDYTLEAAIQLKQLDIETYLFFVDDTLKNSVTTRNKKLASIKGFYDYVLNRSAELGVTLEDNPTIRIKQAKPPKKDPIYIPPEDQVMLLKSIAGSENEVRDRAIFLLMDTTGLRASEMVGLDVNDLDLERQTLLIRHGKGNKQRTVYLTPPCCAVLKTYLKEYRAGIDSLDTAALYVSKRLKKRLTKRAIQKVHDTYIMKAGLSGKNYTLHKHRHAVATSLIKEGKDLMVIKEILGHDTIATTQKYLHLDDVDMRNAINTSSLNQLGANLITSQEDGDQSE